MIQFSENAQGVWRVRLVASNGQIIFATEPFASFANAVDAAGLVQELSPYRVCVEHADGRIETSRNIASLKEGGPRPPLARAMLRSMLDAIPGAFGRQQR
jgi:uncharacterized protein YegP (UPF0339 family)